MLRSGYGGTFQWRKDCPFSFAFTYTNPTARSHIELRYKVIEESLQWVSKENKQIMALIAAGSYASTGGAYRDSSVKKLAALRGAATNLIRTLGQLTSADEDEDEDDTGVEQSDIYHRASTFMGHSSLSPVTFTGQQPSLTPSRAPEGPAVRFSAEVEEVPSSSSRSTADGFEKARPHYNRQDTLFQGDEKRMTTVLMEGYVRKLPLSAAGKDPKRISDKMWKVRYFKLTAIKLEWLGSDDAWTSLGNIVRSVRGKEEKKGELRLRTHFQVRESPFWENALSVEVDQQCLFIRCDSYNTKDQWYRALQEAQKIRRSERAKSMSIHSGIVESAAAVEHLVWLKEDVVDWTGLLEDMAHPESAADKIRVYCAKRLQNHTDTVYNCAWSQDGSMVLTAAKESRMIIWDSNPATPKSKERVAEVNLTGTFTLTCAISPSMRLVAAGGLQENVSDGEYMHYAILLKP